jgi:NADH-ubiquinone oxidoreductase chain 5
MVIFGSITAVIAGLMGFFQDDIKKIISYSTCSQLGYMFYMCGISQYELAFYHLINHAFFKALLFLSGGLIIYIYRNQDSRKISGLKGIIFFFYWVIIIGNIALDGFFFFSSVDSKDTILEVGNYIFILEASPFSILSIISFFLTILYNTTVMYICGGEKYFKRNTVEVSIQYFATLFVLGCLTLLSTYLLLYLFITDAMFLTMYKNSVSTIFYDSESLAYSFKFLIIFLFSTIINFEWALKINKFFSIKFTILNNKIKNYFEGGNIKKIIV